MSEATAAAPQQPTVRPSTVIVTSENAEAFYDERLGAPNAETEAEAGEQVEQVAEPEAATEEPPEDEREHQEEVKKNPKLQKRFSELTEKRKAAEAKAAAAEVQARMEREARERIERERNELKAKYEPPKSDTLGPKPDPQQFQDVNEYSQALEEWTTEKVTLEREKAEFEARVTAHRQQIAKSWAERQAATRIEIADYDAKIAASTVSVSNAVQEAIIESEVGPKILYHLAEHPDFAEKLGKMTITSALREIGKLESKFEGGKQETQAAAKPIAEISKALPPITPLRGANKPVSNVISADGEFHGTYAQWKAARQAGKIK
jgi:hypothetical protein